MPDLSLAIAGLPRQAVNVAMTAAALLLLAAIAWAAPRLGPKWFGPVERRLSRLAAYRGTCIAMVGAVSLILGLLITAITGPPIPRVHDEFSYLLAGDTFARGRLTNPPHPMWRHFETMHVLFEPTYASKFHPAQGLTMAAGRAVFGAPWVGVVVTSALGCGALTWALYGWLRPRWAVLGGLIAALHPQMVIWSHMYWGGGVGVLGGALVFGALPRMLARDRLAFHSAVLAAGGAILALSRPYEAMVWAILSGMTLAFGLLFPHRRQLASLLPRIALPAAAVLIPVVAWMGYYNWRVTGNFSEMPYTLHTQKYMAVPLLFWQTVKHPKSPGDYLHKPLVDQHLVFEWQYFHGQRSPRGWVVGQATKFYAFTELHLLRNLAICVGIAAAPLALVLGRSRRMWLAAGLLGGFFIAYASIPWFEHHYPGAAIAVLFALSMRGLAMVRTIRPGFRRVGQTFVWLCIVSLVPVLATVFAREYRNNRGNWWYERHKIEQQLLTEPGEHLVFVSYQEDHDPGKEWVFNSADIDTARIVWARRVSAIEDQHLMDYYPTRRAWIVRADEWPPPLTSLAPQISP